MKTYLWKFNKESEPKPLGGNDKWMIIDIETGETFYTDYVKGQAPLRTENGELGLGHGMVVTGELSFVPVENRPFKEYALFTSGEDFSAEGKILRGLKLDIPNLLGAHSPDKSRVPNKTWRIYEQLRELKPYNNKYEGKDIEYVMSLDIENVEWWTGNNIFNIGWSLLVEGDVEYFTDEEGLKYARIYK